MYRWMPHHPLQQARLHEIRQRITECLYDPSDFQLWLEHGKDDGIIGKAGYNNLEPLIQFLGAKTGYDCIVFEDDKVYVRSAVDNSLGMEIELPGWAQRYIKALTQNGQKYMEPVTVKDCLLALESI
ncbi:MAG: hypothetical protein HY867_01090 [Chloroflexi bacterium]|nr:hypothetical protein [Chloroflexota bacterium]